MFKRLAIKLSLAGLFALSLPWLATLAANLPQPQGADARPKAEWLASYRWTQKGDWFGGFSGLEIEPGGSRIHVLSDRATYAIAELARDRKDRIRDVTLISHSPLPQPNGDSEGLALSPDGRTYVSFEDKTRVAALDTQAQRLTSLPRPKRFRRYDGNKSFEALAVARNGDLFAVAEKPGRKETELFLWRWNGKGWRQAFAYPWDETYMPVGADFGPDGRLYVLERAFSGIGFRSRLRRFDLSETKADGRPITGDTLLESGLAAHDNLEGVAIWRDTQDRLRATMISDDNFLWIQTTEIVEYLLPD